MSSMVVHIPPETLIKRRMAVLDRLQIAEAELRERAATGVLSGDEWDALEILDQVAFLLGESE